MKISYSPYQYRSNYYPVNRTPSPSFKGGIHMMSGKLNILLSESKKLYFAKDIPELKDFENIIKKISPATKVRPFSEIPANGNISPRTGAYYSQQAKINSLSGEMTVENKIIYLNLNNINKYSKLKLFGDFVHEATHIAQEEATDRKSTVDLAKKMLYSTYNPLIRQDSLQAGG